jgi:hypothetical protein
LHPWGPGGQCCGHQGPGFQSLQAFLEASRLGFGYLPLLVIPESVDLKNRKSHPGYENYRNKKDGKNHKPEAKGITHGLSLWAIGPLHCWRLYAQPEYTALFACRFCAVGLFDFDGIESPFQDNLERKGAGFDSQFGNYKSESIYVKAQMPLSIIPTAADLSICGNISGLKGPLKQPQKDPPPRPGPLQPREAKP